MNEWAVLLPTHYLATKNSAVSLECISSRSCCLMTCPILSKKMSLLELDMKQQIKIMLFLMIVAISIWSTDTSGNYTPGIIHLGDDLTVIISKSVSGKEGPIELPSGHYSIDNWFISRKDKNGVFWTCEGYIPKDKRPFDVVAGHQIELPIGEPIISMLTAIKRGSDVTFNHELQGKLGEKIQIKRDKKRPQAPILRITNTNGSYENKLSFEYG